MDGATYFGIVLLFIVSVILLGIYTTRPRVVLSTNPYDDDDETIIMDDDGIEEEGPPQAGESGFGNSTVRIKETDLIEKPSMSPCSTLSRKPDYAIQPSPEISKYYTPASDVVPTEYNPRTIGDCPPMKPMSSATPLANVPMCLSHMSMAKAA